MRFGDYYCYLVSSITCRVYICGERAVSSHLEIWVLLRASVGTGNIVAARSASFELRTCSPGNERSVLRKRVAAYLWLYTTWLFRRDCLSASRCAICVTKNGQTFWWCARSTVFAVAQRYPGFGCQRNARSSAVLACFPVFHRQRSLGFSFLPNACG